MLRPTEENTVPAGDTNVDLESHTPVQNTPGPQSPITDTDR